MEIGALVLQDVLPYLKYPDDKSVGLRWEKEIAMCISSCCQIAKPRFVYRMWGCVHKEDGVLLKGSSVMLRGLSLQQHIKKAHKTALFAVTLGIEVDRHIQTLEASAMSTAILFDACASAYVEKVCDALEDEIGRVAKRESAFIIPRYSPGYGDFSVAQQSDILHLLDANRKIGLTATNEHVLIPRKSVTAVVGLSFTPSLGHANIPCDSCAKKENCHVRKEGKSCGSFHLQ